MKILINFKILKQLGNELIVMWIDGLLELHYIGIRTYNYMCFLIIFLFEKKSFRNIQNKFLQKNSL